MKANKQDPTSITGRWIRPVPEGGRLGTSPLSAEADLDSFAGQLLRETRRRVSGLAALERELEDRIRLRWEETEAEVRRRVASAEEDLAASRKRMDAEFKDVRLRAEKEGRAAGFREGFARGREEGYRLGFEEGRREGKHEGQQEGREEESQRLESELSGAASALAEAAVDLQQRKDDLIGEARKDLLQLAVEIAKRLLKRDVALRPDAVIPNVEKAIDLIFRRGVVAINVHPDDVPAVEKALQAEPRWAEGFKSVEVRSASNIARGGCRLLSGAGSVDMTLQTQLALIEAALESVEEEPPLPLPGRAEVSNSREPQPANDDSPRPSGKDSEEDVGR